MNIAKVGGTLYRTNNPAVATAVVDPKNQTGETKLNAGADFQKNSALLSKSDSVAKMLAQKRSKKQRQFLTTE